MFDLKFFVFFLLKKTLIIIFIDYLNYQREVNSISENISNKIKDIYVLRYNNNNECNEIISFLSDNFHLLIQKRYNYGLIFNIFSKIVTAINVLKSGRQNKSSLTDIYNKLFDIGIRILEKIQLDEILIKFIDEDYFSIIFYILDILKLEVSNFLQFSIFYFNSNF